MTVFDLDPSDLSGGYDKFREVGDGQRQFGRSTELHPSATFLLCSIALAREAVCCIVTG